MQTVQKSRLLVITDITSLTPGVREPDDGQSMVRLMLYSNEIEIEGLIAGSNLGHGQTIRPDLICQVVEAYGSVQPNLLLHDPAYPMASELLSKIHPGQPIAGLDIAWWNSIGEKKDTEASQAIIQAVDRDDPRPLWVAVWGGTADLAQAIWRVQHNRSQADSAKFIAKLRVHSIGDQDSTGPWLKANFPGLYYVSRSSGFRGMYRGGDTYLSSSGWVETHIKGHGALGDLYPNYDGGDIWSASLGRVRGIKEGDTPSYLGLIQNGLNPENDPTWGDWGGRCVPGRLANRLEDAIDELPGYELDLLPHMATVYRWRPAFQADFQARMDWCLQPYRRANHAPKVVLAGPTRREVTSGETFTLDAGESFDPDLGPLSFRWQIYPDPGTLRKTISIRGNPQPQVELTAPEVTQPETVHVLVEVKDIGEPPLTGYARVIVTIRPRA
jgi:hypothetical protein